MSQQQIPLTLEGVLGAILQLTEAQKETDKQMKKTDEQIEKTSRELAEMGKNTDLRIGSIVNGMGDFIECMVGGGNIVDQFQAQGIAIKWTSRNRAFGKRGTKQSGQIDVFLENGDTVVLIEAKLSLSDTDIDKHIERLEKYRLYGEDKRRIIGAVAGGVVEDTAAQYAHDNGLYVIVQSGRAVVIIDQPEGFVAKEW